MARAERRRRVNGADANTSVIAEFNARHTVAGMLALYGYEHGGGDDWQSPFQTSGSFATRDYGDHWTSLSGSDAAEEIGAASRNGHRWGDAFDLYVKFEHRGDFTAAVRTYGAELDPGREDYGMAGGTRGRLLEPGRWAAGSGEGEPEPEPEDEPAGDAEPEPSRWTPGSCRRW